MSSHLSKKHAFGLLDEITKFNNKISSLIENKVEKYTSKSSEYLVGIIGAVSGGVLGGVLRSVSGKYGISFYEIPIEYFVSVGIIFGIAMAIVLWRGIGQHRLERLNKRTCMIKEKLIDEINSLHSLPTNTPQEKIDELWRIYSAISARYEKKAIKFIR